LNEGTVPCGSSPPAHQGIRSIRPPAAKGIGSLHKRLNSKQPGATAVGDRFADAKSLEEALAACGTDAQWSAKEAATWWYSHENRDRARVTFDPRQVNDDVTQSVLPP
jgi:hypothetical protein